ncbi:MAG: VapC toxin family PIN domain ribonuclease [Rubrivivax sp.]|jgi:predicted nucleic acid-binding protein|nr:VapC toxin family PIN domain ribonuclease [Rubrivivax sp.]
MPSALIDTGVLYDYLMGDSRARQALAPYPHRAISVVSWLELMARCPPGLIEPTRAFLRGFERLSVSESIADEALRLVRLRPGLPLPRATVWASAVVNQLPWVTADPDHVLASDPGVRLAYRHDGAVPAVRRRVVGSG